MNTHHTKYKGDLALTRVMYELSKRGWFVLTPVSEHLPFDLMIYKQIDGKSRTLRIQVKYRENTFQCRPDDYARNDFDFFAIYCATTDRVAYIHLDHVLDLGITAIRQEHDLPKNKTPVYWYEDFVRLRTKKPATRLIDRSGLRSEVSAARSKTLYPDDVFVSKYAAEHRAGNFAWLPSKLQVLVWKHPVTFLAAKAGMSDVALKKRIGKLNLVVPPAPQRFWLNAEFRASAKENFAKVVRKRIAELKEAEV
jgi:hypothetical protein